MYFEDILLFLAWSSSQIEVRRAPLELPLTRYYSHVQIRGTLNILEVILLGLSKFDATHRMAITIASTLYPKLQRYTENQKIYLISPLQSFPSVCLAPHH